jgi:hypothetical protein
MGSHTYCNLTNFAAFEGQEEATTERGRCVIGAVGCCSSFIARCRA